MGANKIARKQYAFTERKLLNSIAILSIFPHTCRLKKGICRMPAGKTIWFLVGV